MQCLEERKYRAAYADQWRKFSEGLEMRRWDWHYCNECLDDMFDFLKRFDAGKAQEEDVSSWAQEHVKAILVRTGWHQKGRKAKCAEMRIETTFQAYIYASFDNGKLDMSSFKLGATYYGGIHVYDMGEESQQKFERFVKMLEEAGLFAALETTK